MKTLILFLALVGVTMADDITPSGPVMFPEVLKIHDELYLNIWFDAPSKGRVSFPEIRYAICGKSDGAAYEWNKAVTQAQKDLAAMTGRDPGHFPETIAALRKLVPMLNTEYPRDTYNDLPLKRALQDARKAWMAEADMSLIK